MGLELRMRWMHLGLLLLCAPCSTYDALDNAATVSASAPRWTTRISHAALTTNDIEKVLHRSHNYTAAQLATAASSDDVRLRRVASNVVSCARVSPGWEQRWYDDARLDAALDDFAEHVPRVAAAVAALRAPPLVGAFVLRADFARLAMIWLNGGFWLDADAACVDDLDAHLPETAGCVLAWEGSVADEPSAPLNWALGCPRRHRFVLKAALLVAARVAAYPAGAAAACAGERELYCARGDGGAKIPVLEMTGPAALGDALEAYAGRRNRALREAAGERADDAATWAAITHLDGVTVLPYCTFRSRGCAHLAPGGDRVLFHHEFDTAWRPSFWHNYHGRGELGAVGDL